MRVIQLSDTHIFAHGDGDLRGMNTAASLRKVIALAQALEPDLVIVTGDLSQDETPESYTHIQHLFAPLAVPVHYLVGNHDSGSAIQQAWGDAAITQSRILVQDGWQLLLLNSTVAGKVWGELSAATLNWLDATLHASPLPALVALHHPPIVPDPDWMGEVLTNSDALYQVVDRHPQTRLVIAGHVHQPIHYQRGNVAYLTAPSTCLQYDQPKDSPLTWHRPGLRWLELYPDGSWVTRIVRVVL